MIATVFMATAGVVCGYRRSKSIDEPLEKAILGLVDPDRVGYRQRSRLLVCESLSMCVVSFEKCDLPGTDHVETLP